MKKPPIKVTVTGAAGRVAYALLFRMARGDMLGADQCIELTLFDLPHANTAIQGVMMELQDCAFPLLSSIVATDDPVVAFTAAATVALVVALAVA